MITETTYTKAYKACEAFFLETGQVPTIEAIKPLIGVNSPSIISSAIKSWKTALSATVRNGQGIDPGVPKALLDAAAAVWGKALEEANGLIKEKQEALAARQKALDAKETALNEEVGRVQQLVNVTEQRFGEEISYLKKETVRLASEAMSAKTETGEFRARATALEKDNAVLAEEIRQEKEKFQRLEMQYEREHAWSLKRIEEEKESHRKQTQHEMNRLQSESTRYKQESDMAHAKLEQLAQQTDGYRDTANLLERELAKEKLKLVELALEMANLQSVVNKKDEKIRLLLARKPKKN